MDKISKIITLLENGQHEEAIKKYEAILRNGTNDERLLLGEELFHYGFLDEAKALYERLLEAYPEEGEILVTLAEICLEQGKEDEALQTLDKIRDTDPSFPESLLLQADLYQMEGLYEVSEQKLLKAKSVLPNEVIVDFALGELYLEQGRFIEAIKSYKKVLPVEKEIAGVSINQRLGDAYSAGGAFEEALPHYERALDESLEINTLFHYAFTALQAGMTKTAIEKFTELKELDHEYHSLYLYLAKAYEREEELELSFETIQEGLRYDEYNKELYFIGGKIALKLGKEDEAEVFLRQALVLDPEFIEAGLTINKLFLHHERYEDVLEIVGIFESNGIEEPHMIWDEAVALQNLEKYSQALNKYQLAYNFLKNDQEFLTDYGYFLMEEGKRDDAAEIFNVLLANDPSNEEFAEVVQRLSDEG
ncbi:tetratricopeptide repeat protein [Robertmurraya massiliosenegalensis]|uniref:tetratricopeptide repeat protein n=1 Tax=Robertmurraya massiliosenegalensis TaxID=1287657 RepID=UPI0002D472E4|nr:tetratricopeptide repeat protein [Robertmurraya massiliosenegalensis]